MNNELKNFLILKGNAIQETEDAWVFILANEDDSYRREVMITKEQTKDFFIIFEMFYRLFEHYILCTNSLINNPKEQK